MEEFKFKQKKNEIVLSVKKELLDGTETEKILRFDCSPKNYQFIKEVSAASKKITEASKGQDGLEKISRLFEAGRDTFELMAPGKWGEFLQFLDDDMEDMISLLQLMVETVKNKGREAKMEEIAPAAPDESEV